MQAPPDTRQASPPKRSRRKPGRPGPLAAATALRLPGAAAGSPQELLLKSLCGWPVAARL